MISDADEPYWRLRWQDQAPAAMAFEQPLLQIEIFQQGQWQPFSRNGRREDDQGFDLAVRWLGANRYEARWYNPASADGRAIACVSPRVPGNRPCWLNYRLALNSPPCRARL